MKSQHEESDGQDSPMVCGPDRDCQIKNNLCNQTLTSSIITEQSNKLGRRRGGCQWMLWLSGRALEA